MKPEIRTRDLNGQTSRTPRCCAMALLVLPACWPPGPRHPAIEVPQRLLNIKSCITLSVSVVSAAVTVYLFLFRCTHIHTYTYAYICMHTYKQAHKQTDKQAYLHACMHACINTYIHIRHKRTCIFIYLQELFYIHSYVHNMCLSMCLPVQVLLSQSVFCLPVLIECRMRR